LMHLKLLFVTTKSVSAKKCGELGYESSRKTHNRDRNRNKRAGTEERMQSASSALPWPTVSPGPPRGCVSLRREPRFRRATCPVTSLSPATIGNRRMLNPIHSWGTHGNPLGTCWEQGYLNYKGAKNDDVLWKGYY
jgi:hypothetical protein